MRRRMIAGYLSIIMLACQLVPVHASEISENTVSQDVVSENGVHESVCT